MSPIGSLFASLLLISVTFRPNSSSNAATTMTAKPINPSTNRFKPSSNSTLKRPIWRRRSDPVGDFNESGTKSKRSKKLESSSVVLINGSSKILSENRTFELGFFNTSDENKWYLGIWFASILTPTFVWVANRETPAKSLASATVEITGDGRLAVNVAGDGYIWKTENTEKGVESKLLDDGNLVLLNSKGLIVWQSFDFPTDTWLPGMNLTRRKWLTCWKSSNNPSPGRYSLRLRPPEYGEIELVFDGSESYWSTGNWTGASFTNVPEMTVRYIYKFDFTNPFTPAASFGYSELPLETGLAPPLTRFFLDSSGQLRQYTWSPQTENWNMFWSQPENHCRVYGLCGNLGVCNQRMLNPCKCMEGFQAADATASAAGDFSGGCRRQSDELCNASDGFEEVGAVSFDGAISVSYPESTVSICETTCLSNCSCIGLYHNSRTNMCKNLYGSLLNIRNSTLDSTINDNLYVRVQKGGTITKKSKRKIKTLVLTCTICGVFVIFAMLVISLLCLRKRGIKRRKEEEEAVFPVTNLTVFSYKELHAATKGFSEKLGHGGFGAVFRGELSDSSPVAVKRLERPGGAEREFRAEVCTIGNIQHVNLVRLRGFCSEDSHRLLVYDYMPNGPLSMYLRQGSQILNWDVRFCIAIGTARGIAYLHEECRDCIIHCDIKPENILLDENFSAKVSDFGLAKLICRDLSRVLATMRGTWGYVAPEWISGVAITAKADVYSYGMTLLELIGGRRNVEGGPPSAGGNGNIEGRNGENWFFPPWAAGKIIEGNVEAVVDQRLTGVYDTKEAERVGLVAVWCIQDDEAMRPTMGMVVKMLEGVVEVTVPPPPKLLQALVSGESFHGVGGDSGDMESSGGGGGGSFGNVQQSIDSKASQLSV